MYRPAAVVIAQTIGDLPIFFVQIVSRSESRLWDTADTQVIFTIIVYFLANLKPDAGLYFTFLLFTYFTTLATTAFFRFVGYSFSTFNDASKVSGTMFSVLVTVSRQYLFLIKRLTTSTPVT